MKSFFECIKKFFSCRHKRALLHANEGFCPDCGKYVKKSYYLARCSFCDIKRRAKYSFGKIAPEEKYCVNCGEEHFVVEKYDTLKLVDIDYAIEVKEETQNELKTEKIEIWIENNNPPPSNNQPLKIENTVMFLPEKIKA